METFGGASSSTGGREHAAANTRGGLAIVRNAPHLLGAPAVEYNIAIPTYGRWRAAHEITNERSLKGDSTPFILVKTLGFLQRHRINMGFVTLFVADTEEAQRYRKAMAGSHWAAVSIVVGVRGVIAQRSLIVRHYKEGANIVSIDDDVGDIEWKCRPGVVDTKQSLPAGALQALIFDAFNRLSSNNAFICGLSTSSNAMSMRMDGITTGNGEVNGFFYFFRNRHLDKLLPAVADVIEDAERSLRYFRHDGIVLRYRMYCGVTRCFSNLAGLQSLLGADSLGRKELNIKRKQLEREAAVKLHAHFPGLAGPPKDRKTLKCLEVNFLPGRSPLLPASTHEELQRNDELEKEAFAPMVANYKAKKLAEAEAKRTGPGLGDVTIGQGTLLSSVSRVGEDISFAGAPASMAPAAAGGEESIDDILHCMIEECGDDDDCQFIAAYWTDGTVAAPGKASSMAAEPLAKRVKQEPSSPSEVPVKAAAEPDEEADVRFAAELLEMGFEIPDGGDIVKLYKNTGGDVRAAVEVLLVLGGQ